MMNERARERTEGASTVPQWSSKMHQRLSEGQT